MDKEYKIILTGEIRENFQAENVKKGLSSLFKKSLLEIEKLFDGNAHVIKKGLTLNDAKKYKKAIDSTGATCKVIKTKILSQNTSYLQNEKDISADTIICPKCSLEEDFSNVRCSRCGFPLEEVKEARELVQIAEKYASEKGIDLQDKDEYKVDIYQYGYIQKARGIINKICPISLERGKNYNYNYDTKLRAKAIAILIPAGFLGVFFTVLCCIIGIFLNIGFEIIAEGIMDADWDLTQLIIMIGYYSTGLFLITLMFSFLCLNFVLIPVANGIFLSKLSSIIKNGNEEFTIVLTVIFSSISFFIFMFVNIRWTELGFGIPFDFNDSIVAKIMFDFSKSYTKVAWFIGFCITIFGSMHSVKLNYDNMLFCNKCASFMTSSKILEIPASGLKNIISAIENWNIRAVCGTIIRNRKKIVAGDIIGLCILYRCKNCQKGLLEIKGSLKTEDKSDLLVSKDKIVVSTFLNASDSSLVEKSFKMKYSPQN